MVQVVAIGTTAADSAEVVEIAGRSPGIFAAVGIQPNHASGGGRRATGNGSSTWLVFPGSLPSVRRGSIATGTTRRSPSSRTGSTGISRSPHERGLPVVIHCRDCQRDIIDPLARLGRPTRGVLHSFTGTWDDAEAFLELGLHISFAGMVTFANKTLDPLRADRRSRPARPAP